MTDITLESAGELAGRLRRRELSSRELLERVLERIERHNPVLNAVVTLDAERARRAADRADALLAEGRPVGPLHGLPITVKDTYEVAGMRTTAGTPRLAEHVPSSTAPAVERLERAGAIVMGKSNVPFLAGDWQSFNAVFGASRNPWDPERTPGGSSGGAAAAVAAGLSVFELGSDIAGSIRVPAAWCGVYGHKPSHGIIPLRGHIPGPPGALSEPDLAVAGPLARSAADLDLVLPLLAGPVGARARVWQHRLLAPRRERLRDYRVAAWLEDPLCPVDDEVSSVLNEVVESLTRAGARVDAKLRPDFSLAEALRSFQELFWPLFVAGLPAEAFARLCRAAEDLPAEADDPHARLVRFSTARHRAWLAANEARERLRARLAELFREIDVILCPAAPVTAIAHDPREPMWDRRIPVNGTERPYSDLFVWASLATGTRHPATVAPVGRARSGLPVGVQIIGPDFEDRTPIDFARRLTDVAPGYEPPPDSLESGGGRAHAAVD